MAFRTFKRHLTAADRRAKETIAACVEGEVGIDYLPDAPRFRYTPARESTAVPRYHGPPSGRGSVPCGKNPLKLKTWAPSRLDANPMYSTAMAGDPPRLTSARGAWANGDPGPLRQYLVALAEEQRSSLFDGGRMNYRFYPDFTGADPRRKLDGPKPARLPPSSCQTDGATPAWEGEPEPLRAA